MFLPSQSPGLVEALDLGPEDVEGSAWALVPSGALRRGPSAILAALDQLLPIGAPVLTIPLRLPAVAAAADAAYGWVARNRGRLPGTPVSETGPLAAIDAATASEIDRRRSRSASARR